MSMEAMAERIRMALGPRPDIVEKRIIGGIGFMLDGNMMVGVSAKGALMVTDENEMLVTSAMAARVALDRDPVALGPPIDLGPDCRGPRA